MSSEMKDLSDEKYTRPAKNGVRLALLSGIIWPVAAYCLAHGLKQDGFNQPSMSVVGPLMAAGLYDFFAGIVCLCVNIRLGHGKELLQSLCKKSGRFCIIGAIFGAPLGMGGYLVALSLVSPAYILPVTSLYPAIAAALAVIFLKERVTTRVWCGILLSIVGCILIGYTPPEDVNDAYFYWGIFFACVAAFGWAAEGVAVTSGMESIHPFIALNIYQMASTCLYAFVIVPSVLLYCYFAQAHIPVWPSVMYTLTSVPALSFVALAGAIACTSSLCWYTAMSKIGVARAMTLNSTYALWSIVLASFFTTLHITISLVMGAVIIFVGVFFVAGKSK